METLSHTELLNLFGSNAYDRMTAYIASCPATPQHPLALQSIALKHQNSPLLALYGLISNYAHSGYYEHALQLGKVQYDLLLQRLSRNNQTQETELLHYLSSAIQHVAKAYFDTGAHESLIAYAESVERELTSAGLNIVLPSMQLYKVEGLIFLERLDEASQEFEPLRTCTNFLPARKNTDGHVIHPEMIQRDNIGHRLNDLLIGPEKLKTATGNKPNEGLTKAIQDGLTILENNLKNQSETFINTVSVATKALNEIQDSNWSNTNDPTAFLKQDISGMDEFTDLARSLLTSSAESRMFDMQRFVERSGQLLVRPETARDPDALRANLPELLQWQSYAKKVRPDDFHCLLWMAGVSYYRLNEYSEAIQQFEQLWDSQESIRLSIGDYNQRAGILSQFPYLFALLCDCYYQTQNAPGLLRAMEASKGRVLADWLEKQSGVVTSSITLSQLADNVPAAMAKLRAHYLSFFLDDDFSFAVLVSKSGQYFTKKVPIGDITLGGWVDKGYTSPLDGIFITSLFKTKTSTSEQLAPFVDWLVPLLQSGIMQPGDHICYCPDGNLHLFPLHYIRFQDNYLIDTFSLSRTQGVTSMLGVISQPARKIDRFLYVQASAKGDDEPKMASFGELGNWLPKRLKGQKLAKEEADFEKIKVQNVPGQLIHFSTHGYFPSRIKATPTPEASPYYDSGLLLYANGQPPSNTELSEWQTRKPFLLSPDRLLRSKWDLKGSHVTLSACVSGQAKEGIGGDALGLDWAFLQSGASSLLSTGWNVDVSWANQFCELFYEGWQNGLSKAEAHRQACLTLKTKIDNEAGPGDLKNPFYWAGFSLTGDWR